MPRHIYVNRAMSMSCPCCRGYANAVEASMLRQCHVDDMSKRRQRYIRAMSMLCAICQANGHDGRLQQRQRERQYEPLRENAMPCVRRKSTMGDY
eukprot:5953090-Lingulodinium_polyedra.AAC.1